MSQVEPALAAAQQIIKKLTDLFEGGLPEPAQISATLRAIPLRHWAVNIRQDFEEAYVLVSATVSAGSLKSDVILRHAAKPTQSEGGFEDDFYGSVRYTVNGDEAPRQITLDRPTLVMELIANLLPALGEEREYAARFERAKLQAKSYRDDLQWATDAIQSMQTGEIKVSKLSGAAARRSVEAECEHRTTNSHDEGDSFKFEKVKAAAQINWGTVSANLIVANVYQSDRYGNDYPFSMAIADLSDASGRRFHLTSDSDFGAHFQAIAAVLEVASGVQK